MFGGKLPFLLPMNRSMFAAAPVFSGIRALVSKRRMAGGVLALMLLLAAGMVRAGSLADLDHDNGLPDAKLGTPINAFQGLQKTEDVGRWLTFKRPGDVLRYGKYGVEGITYNFFKDRLYSINVDLTGKGSVKGVLKLLEDQYGKDHSLDRRAYAQANALLEIREWAGTKVYCVYKSAADFDGGVLTFVDRPTWDLLQIPKKQQQAENREKLKGSFLDGSF